MPTSPSINPAILRALSLNPSTTSISTHGASGFASTFRLTTDSTSLFVKTSSSKGAAVMFEGEYASLNAINGAEESLCPKGVAWGQLDSVEGQKGYFLVTEFLDLSATRSSSTSGNKGNTGSGMSLAQKLAKLHTSAIPSDFQGKGYGFPVSTCCGETSQDNTWKEHWSTFFAENRLLYILKCAEQNNGVDHTLRNVVQEVVDKVVPRLLGEGYLGGSQGIKPVVCHGDLWSGNKGRGSFIGRQDNNTLEEVVFDPSVCYGHNEYDHGIMNMFGGFGSAFWKEYFRDCPKTEPAEEYEDRVKLYEAYHHLNHYSMFGGGYKSGAVGILKGLLKKYG